MTIPWPPQFFYAVCQRGAEQALKQEIAAGPLDARLAFSRPGFVTFKLSTACQQPQQFELPSTFARTHGFCLGKVSGQNTGDLTRQIWSMPVVKQLLTTLAFSDLHVWQRDNELPGAKGFQPGVTLLAREIEAAVRRQSPIDALRNMSAEPRRPSPRNSWVLDVVLVEPAEWWIGCHRITRRHDAWPGGVPPLTMPAHAVSRAYLKMAEALDWSALPIMRDEVCLELGCAPGGAAQALLERGLRVIGVDPAEVDPELAAHGRFHHLRRRSTEIPHRELRGVRWVAADMNVAPKYTLDAVEEIVSYREAAIRGLLLTLKLADWKLAEELPQLVERVRSWGFHDVRTRQLAFNRQEVCVVALRSRGQRRMHRRSHRRRRTDAAHASKPPAPKLRANI